MNTFIRILVSLILYTLSLQLYGWLGFGKSVLLILCIIYAFMPVNNDS